MFLAAEGAVSPSGSSPLLVRFAEDYARAQHSLEWTNIAGGAAFEIILTVVLAAFTGGLGAAALFGSKARLRTPLKKLGELFEELAKRRRKVKLGEDRKKGGAPVRASRLEDYVTEEKVPKPERPPKGNSKREQGAVPDNKGTNYALFNKIHQDSLPKPKGRGPNGGRLQSHHGLQQQWAKEHLSQYKYDADLAPSITIETGKGHPHTAISNLQNARRDARAQTGQGKWSSSLQDELQYIVDDMSTAGFSKETIDQVLQQQYKMLDKLNVPYQKLSN